MGRMSENVPGLPVLERCAVMGVVNVTPDSFSDGGMWLDPAKAVAHGLDLVARGADLVDVGGESTRPGAVRVTEAEELRRVVPVVTELARAGVVVSVDTMRASVAAAAVAAGARVVNDVSGGLADPEMAGVVADTGAPFVVMHWRGQSADMDALAVYGDVVADVVRELTVRVEELLAAGVKQEQLILDPGLGFAKTGAHNWALLGRLDALTALGRPVLVAASRKRFLGTLLADPETGELRPARQRDDATAAVSVLSAKAGAWAVRVHDVSGTADAVRVVAAWEQAAQRG
ncbi:MULTISPECIES: dihydropteroate synthase [Kitasatospora]|uniref:dihydropteroate synthase n=1 Tax=Kitasatospora TaxID=2063 RepID=UPI0004C32E06|nr:MULTISPECIES: dihydropteroate synthase [unclassified Kitasatospora]WAL73286.1 dihydropteroate synthase [Kitasatospora sp. YST-16]WNW39341.1 dihydropteroate synthase [Streptomyces sp. Li-HN-5-13]